MRGVIRVLIAVPIFEIPGDYNGVYNMDLNGSE